MTSSAPPPPALPKLGRARDWLLGAALLMALIIAVDRSVGWGPLLAPWHSLSWLSLALLFILTALSWLLRAVRVYEYFQPQMAGRFATVVRLSLLHNSANNLLPMRAGEVVFPWLMRRWFGHGFLSAGASLIWIRLLDLHFLGLVAILILWLREPSWVWPLAALGWLALLPLLARIGSLLPAGRQGDGALLRALRFVATAAPSGDSRVARIYLWTTLSWTAKFLAFATLMQHFVPVAFWRVLAGVMGAELSSVLPFHGIAGAGSYELAGVAAMVPLGVAPEQALTGVVNLHLFMLGTTLLLGGLALLPLDRRSGR